MNAANLYESPALQLNADTCVDVKARGETVVLGQLGKCWMHDLHMSPEEAMLAADYLTEAATACIAARERA